MSRSAPPTPTRRADPLQQTLTALTQIHTAAAKHWNIQQAHYINHLEDALCDFSPGADERLRRLGEMERQAGGMQQYHSTRAAWLSGSVPADTLFWMPGEKGVDVARISKIHTGLEVFGRHKIEGDEGQRHQERHADLVDTLDISELQFQLELLRRELHQALGEEERVDDRNTLDISKVRQKVSQWLAEVEVDEDRQGIERAQLAADVARNSERLRDTSLPN
ncbi:hypothetical protein CcaverHIS002_0703690 [Cutaneotrichosporon cavernicola]|uniref:Uncharacterized protein n=1 Tax=Cutaneotrichosporon cavernicola TaxID=279322 RepID=A0AA48LAC8_9TREE|nr:uncharacterized protein CcaverHIS019_0703770 [Cutaneotrichosporon cavernicola]BEI87023.1 hypothetical protein CcaverHIS002_0703690 [Cutaneotrichosporon cavernicola]BEI94796.1 hypothetical protein CcaverHIS019_0703770 [Cutaneotrichosporon cavernicola]BEJ02571.1 hypothetical protein CcaverHIS631_0703660 [Cutaneotrichosporon cavernicola]BEJ10327.1 hypothetical protein CcaverHIS641_0703620 [Cutaneotrichosporon cavernicola]